MSTYTIEQRHDDIADYGWKPIPDGEFSTREEAEAAMRDLQENLGRTALRIVESGAVNDFPNLTDELLGAIAAHMDDDIREGLHSEQDWGASG